MDFYRVWVVAENVFYFWLPFLILVPVNTATWIKVNRSSRKCLTDTTAQMIRRTRHVLILTSLISAGFVLFVSPICALFLWEVFQAEDFTYPLYNGEIWDVLQLISECLYLCNHSCNFFLYILSGKRFRKSLRVALCISQPPQ